MHTLWKVLKQLLVVFLGAELIVLLSHVAFPLPMTQVPITLQTFGISLLAMTLGPFQATAALIVYLACATLGLPVLAGGTADPHWMASAKAGYLCGFALSAFLLSTLLKVIRPRSFCRSWLVFAVNESTVLLMGMIWLSFYVGMEKSVAVGLLPFVPGALIKISAATLLYQSLTRLYNQQTT